MTTLSSLTSATGITVSDFSYQKYVNRGDPSAYDFNVGDFTTDDTYRDLDLSSIVPSDAIAVQLKVAVKDDAAGSIVYFRKNGNSSGYTAPAIVCQVANVINYATFVVPCDSSQVIEYRATNTTFTTLSVVVIGWFTESEEAAVGSGNVLAGQSLPSGYLVKGSGGTEVEDSTIYITGDGEMTNPSQPCFLANPSAQQQNIATGGVTVVFDNEVIDVGNNFASNTFTAPVTGKYQLNAMVRVDALDSGATFYYIRIYTSNGNFTDIIDPAQFAGDLTYFTFKASVVADMDANDTAYVQIYQSGGTAQTDVSTDSYFSGALIC